MRVVGQTLFLGASVVSFSSNVGWGGNNSSITVELIEDLQPFGKTPFRKFSQTKSADYGDLDLNSTDPLPNDHPGSRDLGGNFYNINFYNNTINYPDNHYYTCIDDDCYIDENGNPYSSSTTKKEKNVPGKIYYEWVNNRFVSKYWYGEDPGFFATGTRINPNGIYEPSLSRDIYNSNLYIYDIINTPVYFKFDNFEFIGLVKDWTRNNRPGGITYSVTIESFDELLDNCHMILQSFNGAIFNIQSAYLQNLLDSLGNAGIANVTNLSANQIGGPVNFPLPSIAIGSSQKFDEKIKLGNLPNVFNVYGFLESMGDNGFGGSKLNSEGLRANDIIDAIQTLTSSDNFGFRLLDKAFSPFGRILTKNIANARDQSIVSGLKSFGVITYSSPTRNNNPAQNYNSFKLDLSSIPRPPDNYRIQGNPNISISSFIRQLSDDTGVDFLSVVIPISDDNNTDFIIKIVTVDRKNYNPLYQIPSVVASLENKGFQIENSSFGQEKNNNFTRKLVFGGNQQRLYQVKNYRLSYNQTNYIYNTITKEFMNLDSTKTRNKTNKIRNPSLSSTRNKILSDFIHPDESSLFLRDDIDKDIRFSTAVSDWGDIEIDREDQGSKDYIVRGNYEDTLIFNNEAIRTGTRFLEITNPDGSTVIITEPVYERYISLFDDVISPYFGFKTENNAPIGDNTNEFRLHRPVLIDTWTNQITVLFDMNELPLLSIGELMTLYDPSVFSTSSSSDINGGLSRKQGSITSNQTQQTPPTDFGGAASQGIDPTRTLNYRNPGFTIKETEFRCSNFDSYLTYCLGKSIYSKPDLFTMLVNAYKDKGIFLTSPRSNTSTPTNETGLTRGSIGSSRVNINQDGIPGDPSSSIRTKMDINWDLWLNHNFIKDLQILFSFIKSIGDKYYGKKYAIKAPSLYSYKDTQYANIQLPSKIGNISIYQGGTEIFYDYEIAEGAWEEYGNYIDDSIVCGDNNWHVLRNDDGLIPTIVGYNSSNNIDYVTKFWCELSYEKQIAKLQEKITVISIPTTTEIDKDIEDIKKLINGTNTIINYIRTQINNKKGNNKLYQGKLVLDAFGENDPDIAEIFGKEAMDSGNKAMSYNNFLSFYNNKLTEYNKQLKKLEKEKIRIISTSRERLKQLQIEKSEWNKKREPYGGFWKPWEQEYPDEQKELEDLTNLFSLITQLRTAYRDSFDCSDPNKISIPSLDIADLDVGSYVLLEKAIKNTDAFGGKVNSSKLYTKSNSDKIIFLNPINLSDPRIVVDATPVKLASSSYSYLSDPNLTVISNIAMEDFCIFANLNNENNNFIFQRDRSGKKIIDANIDSKEAQYLRYLLQYVYTIDPTRLVPLGVSTNTSPQNYMVEPKMATPFFVAAPLKMNRAVYGPWTNYPGLVMNSNLADNLIGNIKIEQNADYVPWNYGGMSFLDKVISYEMNVDVNYQNTIENGRVSIVGPPIFSIGGVFTYEHINNLNLYRNDNNYMIYDNNYYQIKNTNIMFIDLPNKNTAQYTTKILEQNTYGSSAVISNISIQTSDNGIRTTYSFQTYNPKTGLFNKQFSDNIRKQNSQLLKFNKILFGKNNNISNTQLKNFLTAKEKSQTNREPYSVAKHSTQLFGNSPVELIIGQAAGFAPIPENTITVSGFNETIRNHHYAAIFPGSEVGAELLNDYDSKAAMSLDGLLSPISFYPTRLNSTYSISSLAYKDKIGKDIILYCPRCSNKRYIIVDSIDYSRTDRPRIEIRLPCPVCSKSKLSNDNKPIKQASVPDNINLYSLNPIIVNNGEFTNPHTTGLLPKHSIVALARGEKLPVGDQSFVLHANLVLNSGEFDYNEIDLNKKNSDNVDMLMNQRFFGLRGPLMLHSWGFDTDGYPVPNANDEAAEIDDKNRPKRFILTSGLNDLNKSGLYEPIVDGDGVTIERLGDIIPVNYTWNGTKYVKKSNKKSEFFHKKWGERPDLWPVGPIDLRWDHQRKVWDASGSGACKEEVLPPFIISDKNDLSTLTEFLANRNENKCPYKMVYLTLEQDMIREDNFESTVPARAFIDDIEYSKEPLQNNYRRLVYVIDKAGYTAPRGAKLLCRYNRDNGFYEPISKPILTALGTINGLEAKIEMSYTQGRRAGVLPIFTTNFVNPLNLKTGNKGLFNYINGKWTLVSTG